MKRMAIILALFAVVCFIVPTVLMVAEEKETKEDSPAETLKKAAEAFYDIKEQGVLRYACFVNIPGFEKTVNLRTKVILESVNYELIWEPDKPIKVKPRDIPAYFKDEGTEDAHKYAAAMEVILKELFKTIGPVNEIANMAKSIDSSKYNIVSSKDKDITKLEITPVKQPEPASERRPPRPRRGPPRERKEPGDKEEPEERPRNIPELKEKDAMVFKSLIIWVNKYSQITKFETVSDKEKTSGTVTSQKYSRQRNDNLWGIKQLELVKKDNKDAFLEKLTVSYVYTYQDNIMLPSAIVLTRLDEDNKVLSRRNEPNPLTINFSKYELEKRKEKK